MYPVIPSLSFDHERKKLHRRDPALAEALEKKIVQISLHPEHFKPLRGAMKGFRRVHVGSYVLIYEFKDDTVHLIALNHHDIAYKQ